MFPVTRAREIRAFWWKIGNSIAASAQAPKVNFLSTAQNSALNDRTACSRTYIGGSVFSLKFEFSFLNGNLMVPAGHQIIFGEY
jgi:hypothetical protein